jgi:hypothetical protein
MFDRFERPVKIICLAMAALLVWELGSLVFSGDPLARLKIPALPRLAGATNEPAKIAQGTNGTNATNAANATNLVNVTNAANATNAVNGTNVAKGTNLANGTNVVKGTNVVGDLQKPGGKHGPPPGMTPEMMAQMMAGGMPGGPMGGGMKKIELPPEVTARVDRIVDSEIFGPVMRPVPMALLGIAEHEAFIQATNGQIGPVKVGGELGGIKLLRIGINRVLVEQGGEKQELTVFGGAGGESLMPPPTDAPSTNAGATNAPSTNAPTKKPSIRNATTHDASTTPALSSKEKETQ